MESNFLLFSIPYLLIIITLSPLFLWLSLSLFLWFSFFIETFSYFSFVLSAFRITFNIGSIESDQFSVFKFGVDPLFSLASLCSRCCLPSLPVPRNSQISNLFTQTGVLPPPLPYISYQLSTGIIINFHIQYFILA